MFDIFGMCLQIGVILQQVIGHLKGSGLLQNKAFYENLTNVVLYLWLYFLFYFSDPQEMDTDLW